MDLTPILKLVALAETQLNSLDSYSDPEDRIRAYAAYRAARLLVNATLRDTAERIQQLQRGVR